MPRYVLSQPIGIETKGGEFTPLLQGVQLPATARMSFSTAEDNQRVVSVKLYQGSHPKAAFNRQICAFDVVDLPPEPQGVPSIELMIEISANGALRAAARDVKSGRSHDVRFDERSAGIEIRDLDAPATPTPRLAAPIGIETKGGMFTPIFAAGARVPAALSEVFSTAADNQNAVSLRLYQGLSEKAAENRLLGAFDLTDIPLAPMGVPQIEVHFAVAADGALTVTARDKGTGKHQRVVIDGDDARADVQLADPATDFNDFKDIFDRLFSEGTDKLAPTPERPAAQRRVFISHASPDAHLAQDLVDKLERGGRACWIAPRDVRAGEDYRAEIVAALKSVSHVVALISEASNHSPHVLREIALAEQYGKRIVPIRVDDVEMRSELEYILQGVHWVRVEGAAEELGRIL